MNNSKTIFITGGSSGFGEAIIKQALQNNHKVIATFRKEEEVKVFNQNHGDSAFGVLVDVTNKNQIQQGVEEAINKFGKIDVLINNAGRGVFGLFESIDREKYDTQFDVNVMGLIDVTNAVLPHMRERKSGQIFNFSSAVGIQAMPGATIYCASKFAVEGLTESLRQEVETFNIGVTLIEPGAFDTKFFDNSTFDELRSQAPDGYEDVVKEIEDGFKELTSNPAEMGDPEKLAMVVVDLINHEESPARVPLGSGCIENFENKIEDLQQALDEWKEIGNSMRHSDNLKIEKVA